MKQIYQQYQKHQQHKYFDRGREYLRQKQTKKY